MEPIVPPSSTHTPQYLVQPLLSQKIPMSGHNQSNVLISNPSGGHAETPIMTLSEAAQVLKLAESGPYYIIIKGREPGIYIN